MGGILHVEPIMRRIKPPLTIGHTDFITYGSKIPEDDNSKLHKTLSDELDFRTPQCYDDDELLGDSAVFMQLGSPLETIDFGSNAACVPLVKTIECMSDDTSDKLIYTESVHYLKDQKFLIPLRTKIHTGRSEGLRVSHLPSLNYARKDLSGDTRTVNEVRSEIVSELVEKDKYFVRNYRHPVINWIKDDLVNNLSTSPITDIRFDTERLNQTIYNFIDDVERVPHEMNSHHLRRVMSKISLEGETIPSSYFSDDVLHRTLLDIKQRIVPNSFNFRSCGRLPIDNIPNLEYNPQAFQSILGKIDRLSLTDYNVDVIVEANDRISFIKDHVAVDRFSEIYDRSVFTPNEVSSNETDIVNEQTLRQLLDNFRKYHSAVKDNDELQSILCLEPVKIKIIKTMADEALILVYRFNSTSKDDPLCGVYFDIALQSLAPLTIWKPNLY